MKANSVVRACVPAAGKVLEGDDKQTLLREDVHYLHYITITVLFILMYNQTLRVFCSVTIVCCLLSSDLILLLSNLMVSTGSTISQLV